MCRMEVWFQKDEGFLLFSLGVIPPPICVHIASMRSFMVIQELFIERPLCAGHCVGSKELGACPPGMYSKHVQRYIHGDESSSSKTGT